MNVDENKEMPFPVLFNPFKHHRNYILDILKVASPGMIISLLSPIYNNYIDIYTGNMTPEAICSAVISFLKSNGVLEANDFKYWVSVNKGYRQIKLQDWSEWVVRKSNDSLRYIHLHPARMGQFTFRFKGSTLKTVYLLKASFGGRQENFPLETVNCIRNQIGLSPVKKLDQSKGILKCYKQFFMD